MFRCHFFELLIPIQIPGRWVSAIQIIPSLLTYTIHLPKFKLFCCIDRLEMQILCILCRIIAFLPSLFLISLTWIILQITRLWLLLIWHTVLQERHLTSNVVFHAAYRVWFGPFFFLPFELQSRVLDQKQTDFNKVDRLGTSLVQTTIWRFAMGNLLAFSFLKFVIILDCTDTTGRIYCSSNSERLYHSVVLFVWMELMQLMFYFTVSVRQPSKWDRVVVLAMQVPVYPWHISDRRPLPNYDCQSENELSSACPKILSHLPHIWLWSKTTAPPNQLCLVINSVKWCLTWVGPLPV